MVHEAYVYSFYWFHSFITCVDLGQNDQNLCQPPKELPLRSGLLLAPVAAWTGSMPMEERIRTNECIAVWRPTTQRRARWKGRKGMGHLGDGFGIPWKSWNILKMHENSTASFRLRFAIFLHEFSTDFTCQAGSWIFRKSMQVPRLRYHCACCCHFQRVSQSEKCIMCGISWQAIFAFFLPTDPKCVAYICILYAYDSIFHRQASMCLHVCHCQNWGKWPILRDSHKSIDRELSLCPYWGIVISPLTGNWVYGSAIKIYIYT